MEFHDQAVTVSQASYVAVDGAQTREQVRGATLQSRDVDARVLARGTAEALLALLELILVERARHHEARRALAGQQVLARRRLHGVWRKTTVEWGSSGQEGSGCFALCAYDYSHSHRVTSVQLRVLSGSAPSHAATTATASVRGCGMRGSGPHSPRSSSNACKQQHQKTDKNTGWTQFPSHNYLANCGTIAHH